MSDLPPYGQIAYEAMRDSLTRQGWQAAWPAWEILTAIQQQGWQDAADRAIQIWCHRRAGGTDGQKETVSPKQSETCHECPAPAELWCCACGLGLCVACLRRAQGYCAICDARLPEAPAGEGM